MFLDNIILKYFKKLFKVNLFFKGLIFKKNIFIIYLLVLSLNGHEPMVHYY